MTTTLAASFQKSDSYIWSQQSLSFSDNPNLRCLNMIRLLSARLRCHECQFMIDIKNLFIKKSFSPESDFITFANFWPIFQFITIHTLTSWTYIYLHQPIHLPWFTCAHTHTLTYTHQRSYMHTCIHCYNTHTQRLLTHIHTHIGVYMSAPTHTHTHTHTHIYIPSHLFTVIYIYKYICSHIHLTLCTTTSNVHSVTRL